MSLDSILEEDLVLIQNCVSSWRQVDRKGWALFSQKVFSYGELQGQGDEELYFEWL